MLKTTARGHLSGILLSLLAVLAAGNAWAAPLAVHTVKTDLRPLIRAGVQSPAQFAVQLPNAVSSATGGTWSSAGGKDTWRYAVQVPTAVSMSFHAVRVVLPESATLVVRGARTTTSYRARDLHRGELWSRIQPGAALEFTLQVAARDRAQVAFSLVSLQAGYRSLGAGVADHPYYRQLLGVAPVDNTPCVTNYQCKVTPANTPAGAATVALVVGGLYQCTGTLINDVPQDNVPYVLTARHCLSGKVGIKDDPTGAQSLQVYWDATSSCGGALGSLYDPGTPTQTGATTVVEQQDAWLVKLDVNPVVADAQFAGFDASGAAVQGGYTIHHAEGFDKQFVAWNGQPAPSSRFAGFSDFLETVNQVGNIGPGASGSALFDQNNRVTGSLTYGRETSDPSGYNSCPMPTPPTPNGSNGVADFTALAAVWNSTGDSTSSTGAATIKAALDPHASGTVVIGSIPAAVVMLSASTNTLSFGDPLQLTWTASNASQCTAAGGASGDGWGGTLATQGSVSLTETVPNFVTYTITCSYSAGRTATASTTVSWLGPTPQLTFTAPATVWTTRPAILAWTSNVGPCAVSGGGLDIGGLPTTGSVTTTQPAPADVTYTLTCGPSNESESTASTVSYVTPNVVFEANGTDRKLGENFFLSWLTYGDSCTPSGGAPGDGWSTNSFNGGAVTFFAPQVTAAGTYEYALTCSSGPLSVQQTVSVTFEQDAGYATASLAQASVPFSASPADYVDLSYNSNLSSCNLIITPTMNFSGDDPFAQNNLPQGQLTLIPDRSGTYQLQMSCASPHLASAVTSTPVTLTVTPAPPPTATITFNPTTVVAGEALTVAWSSSNATSCSSTGGIPGGNWSNGAAFLPSGSDSEMAQAGQFTFQLTCQSIDPSVAPVTVSQTLDVVVLADTLSANATSVTEGSSFTLTWSSTGATGCTAAGGGANGAPWSGALPVSGTATQTATTTGSFTYELDCTAGMETSSQTVNIAVTAKASTAPPSGGGGGGGALDLGVLTLLGGLLARRTRRAAALNG
jgi:hypothetical protein